jgi:hypothetical protein
LRPQLSETDSSLWQRRRARGGGRFPDNDYQHPRTGLLVTAWGSGWRVLPGPRNRNTLLRSGHNDLVMVRGVDSRGDGNVWRSRSSRRPFRGSRPGAIAAELATGRAKVHEWGEPD